MGWKLDASLVHPSLRFAQIEPDGDHSGRALSEFAIWYLFKCLMAYVVYFNG